MNNVHPMRMRAADPGTGGHQTVVSAAEPVLRCVDVYRTFTDGKIPVSVLNGVNFSVQRGERIAIMGSSGSGKSTLLQILGGLDQVTSGTVWVGGENIHALSERKRAAQRNRVLGFIYQFHHLLPEFTALENVAMPLMLRRMPIEQAMAQARHMLQQVGLSHRVAHKMHALSGGERQRVAIARAVVGEPDCVLADEPTGNLDSRNAERAIDVLLELNQQQGMAIVLVTHDPAIAAKMQTRYEMKNGVLNRFSA